MRDGSGAPYASAMGEGQDVDVVSRLPAYLGEASDHLQLPLARLICRPTSEAE